MCVFLALVSCLYTLCAHCVHTVYTLCAHCLHTLLQQHLADANQIAIATTGGIEAVAYAMANHPDSCSVQKSGASAIVYMVGVHPDHIARASAAGVEPGTRMTQAARAAGAASVSVWMGWFETHIPEGVKAASP